MDKQTNWNGLKLSTPATYRIRVQGHIGSNWADWIGGMTFTHETTAEMLKVSTLKGHLPDQAALLGVLNNLYDLRLPLLSVDCLDALES